MSAELAAKADELAGRVNRLTEHMRDRDGEAYHVERDAIARELRAMAKTLRGEGGGRRRIHTWRA